MTKLKSIREKSGLSQSQLAQKADISTRTLQDYEQGKRNINMASAMTVIKLASALNVQPIELMEEIGGKINE